MIAGAEKVRRGQELIPADTALRKHHWKGADAI